MKHIILTFLFSCFSIFGYSQDSPAPKVVSIDEVNFPPSWKDCETKGLPCTFESIQHHLLRNFNSNVVGPDRKDRAVVMNIKFIIDSSGDIAWARAVGPSREIEAEGVRIMENLPTFNPGRHEGKEVNVLVDFPLKLNFAKKRAAESNVSANFSEVDSPPLLGNCPEGVDPRNCTSGEVQQFVNYNFNTSGLPSGYHETVVKFVIDKEGNIQDVFAEGLNEKFNLKAIKVVEKLPKFRPGFLNGESVNTVYLLPIKIQVF